MLRAVCAGKKRSRYITLLPHGLSGWHKDRTGVRFLAVDRRGRPDPVHPYGFGRTRPLCLLRFLSDPSGSRCRNGSDKASVQGCNIYRGNNPLRRRNAVRPLFRKAINDSVPAFSRPRGTGEVFLKRFIVRDDGSSDFTGGNRSPAFPCLEGAFAERHLPKLLPFRRP